jgi:hypothetical protein
MRFRYAPTSAAAAFYYLSIVIEIGAIDGPLFVLGLDVEIKTRFEHGELHIDREREAI